MTRIHVEDRADGGLVVRKVATCGADERRLAHERTLLRAARHPGVVELLESDGDDLLTRYVGSHTLETTAPTDVERVVALAAALADTAGALHSVGVVHLRIAPDHVLLGTRGQPVLCGFGGAAFVGAVSPASAPPLPEIADPAAGPGRPADPATDVFAIGALVRLMLDDLAGDGSDPVPDRRWDLRRRRADGYRRRALLNLADHATADDPASRPTAAALAASLRDLAVAARTSPLRHGREGRGPLGRLAAPQVSSEDSVDDRRDIPDRLEERAPTGPRRRRVMAGVIASVGVVLLLSGLRDLAGGEPAAVERSSGPGPTQQAEEASSTTTAVTSEPAPDRTTGCPEVTDGAFDADGDGCPERATVSSDGVAAVGARRFTVASAGDVVVVGDWDCDGSATPAVLRAGGTVFRYDRWATAGDAVTATFVGTAAGATSLAPGDGPCPRLVALAADGSEVAILP